MPKNEKSFFGIFFALSAYIYRSVSQDNITSGNALNIAECDLGRYRKVFANFA